MSEFEHNISIGELSALTEISPHTLRIWEKRYGFPRAERLPSGHRRYRRQEVPRLRAVNRALAAGFRISKIVGKDLEDLEKLLSLEKSSAVTGSPMKPGEGSDALSAHQAVLTETWINCLHDYNEQKLTNAFYQEWEQRGPLNFIVECAVPFLNQIGARWCKGELSVAQEHFGSERLYDFLGSMWRRLNERNAGEPVVLTTLPDEAHRLGLQMCAVLVAWTGRRVVYLGPNTPLPDIAASLEKCGARQLVISVSGACEPDRCLTDFHELRNLLRPGVTILAGGAGLPEYVTEVKRFTSMNHFYDYLKTGK